MADKAVMVCGACSMRPLPGVGRWRTLVSLGVCPAVLVSALVPTMSPNQQAALVAKLQQLTAAQLEEVVDFVEFLQSRSARRAALDRLLAVAPAVQAAGFAELSEDEVAAEIAAARVARRGP